MSWTLSLSYVEPDEVEEKLKEAKNTQLETQPFDSWDDDVEAQMDAAIPAAGALASVIRDKRVTVTVAGHARREAPQVQVDSVTVSLYGYNPPPKEASTKS